jgi:hypothetical protein
MDVIKLKSRKGEAKQSRPPAAGLLLHEFDLLHAVCL